MKKLTKDGKHVEFFPMVSKYLIRMWNNPVIPLLTVSCPNKKHLDTLFEEFDRKKCLESTANLLQAILKVQVKSSFHKINVHAALTPAEIKALFSPVIEQAFLVQTIYQKIVRRIRRSSSSGSSRLKKVPFAAKLVNLSSEAGMEDIYKTSTPLRTPFVTVCEDVCMLMIYGCVFCTFFYINSGDAKK